jgi:hypothetical protein
MQVMFPSACTFIVCWFPLAFTTCFGLHGHLQGRRIYIYIYIYIYMYCRLCFRLRASLLYVGFYCLSLHVSAYMAIFKGVGYIYIYTMGIAGYVSVCVQLYCILVSTVFHYTFRPTWPSSSVYDSSYIYFHILKGFCI